MLGRQSTRILINGHEWPLRDVGYDSHAISQEESDPGNRFILEVRLSGHAFPQRIDASRRSEQRDELDASRDHHAAVPFVEMVRRNDPRFANHVLRHHYHAILDDVLTKASVPAVVLTSLDAMFAKGNTLYMAGGCRVE